MIYLQLVASLGLLLVGGELLVRGAVAIARRLGTSELMIGLTLVGFGTSTPELVTSLDAALVGAPGIAVGNVVGSNIANVLLILGTGALIMPMRTTREAFRRDGPVLLGASVLLAGAGALEVVPRAVGAIFLALLLAYTCYTYWTERAATNASAAMHAAEADALGRVPGGLGTALASALGGLAGVLIGASLLVEAAIGIARTWGVSDAVIGLTIVAVGTSLPELATTVVAALRRQADVAFGNSVGSNIFNILGILGTTTLVAPLAVPASIAGFDVWVMLASAIVGSGCAMFGWRVNRLEGGPSPARLPGLSAARDGVIDLHDDDRIVRNRAEAMRAEVSGRAAGASPHVVFAVVQVVATQARCPRQTYLTRRMRRTSAAAGVCHGRK